jgi:hypothetical protein
LFRQRTSANVNSLLQTATLNSLEAWPERESVTVLAHTSDHSVKAFMLTLLVSHQRLTMLRQRTASNVIANGRQNSQPTREQQHSTRQHLTDW